MSTHRYAVPVETTGWSVDSQSVASFDWEYDAGRQRLLNLYDKGKAKQWDAKFRIDWDIEVDPTDRAAAPDELVPIFGSPTWERLTREQKDTVRHHYSAWTNSQFLHGEQGALICAAKIVETVPDVDAKFYAATQTMDEARHVEAYSRYVNDKLQLAYPITGPLKTLLEDTISDDRWDFTYLGMQVMIEGVALAAFSMIRDFTQEPLAKQLNAYVMQDEARHVAFGRLALKDAYADIDEAERAEREEFVIEASYLLRDRFLAEDVWAAMEFDVDECVTYVDNHQMMGEFRKALFSRVVPCVKDIGLWGPRVQQAFVDLGVMQFQDLDLDELGDNDDRIAEEMEAELAARKAAGAGLGTAGRGEQLAETIVAAEG